MAKKTIFWVMLVMVLAFGMTVVGCGPEPETKGNKIIITGISYSSGYRSDDVVLNLWDENGSWIASGQGSISKNTATVYLEDDSGAWMASGQYGIGLLFASYNDFGLRVDNDTDDYYFTNGKTFEELGITSDPGWGDERGNLPKYNFVKSSTTIEFDKFKPWEEEWEEE